MTFTKPSLDGHLSLLDIIFSHKLQSFHHPLFRYVDACGDIRTIVWGEAVKAFNLATQYTMKNTASNHLGRVSSTTVSSKPFIIGILANLGL